MGLDPDARIHPGRMVQFVVSYRVCCTTEDSDVWLRDLLIEGFSATHVTKSRQDTRLMYTSSFSLFPAETTFSLKQLLACTSLTVYRIVYRVGSLSTLLRT
jgi:hypothetical protein